MNFHSKIGCLSIWIVSLLIFPLNAQQNYIRFRYITNENGLSQNNGKIILQDNLGFMWFGTEMGVNRYDGNNITVFKYDPLNPNSITNNYINTMYCDSKGNIAIGTDGGGLCYFDVRSNRVNTYRRDSLNDNSLSDDIISTICEDKSHFLWVGTPNGLNKLDLSTGKVKRYFNRKDDTKSLLHNVVASVYCDYEGVIWIGTLKGLCKYDPSDDCFVQYDNSPRFVTNIKEDADKTIWFQSFGHGLSYYKKKTGIFFKEDIFFETLNKLSNNRIADFVFDEAGNMWIASADSGLIFYRKDLKKFYRYQHELYLPNSISANQLRSVYLDKAGVLWVGTFTSGICYFDTKQKPFNHFATDEKRKYFFKSAQSVMQDSDGDIWLGMPTGIIRYNIEENICEKISHSPANHKSIPGNEITKIIEDRNGLIWIASNTNGIFTYNKKSKTVSNNFTADKKMNVLLSDISAWELFEDADGDIWVGTWNNGAFWYDRKNNHWTQFLPDKNQLNSISSISVISIDQDKQGYIWIGTWEGGLNKYDKKNKSFTLYKNDKNNPNSLSSNILMDIYMDNDGVIWLGTFGAGFDRFDPLKNEFTHYTENDGLANNNVFGIEEDSKGNLWICCNKGISKFNKSTRQFRNYNTTDGVQGNEFSQHGSFKCKNGYILFAGSNGFNYFFPDSINDNPYQPPVIITDFKIFNRSVRPEDSTFLKMPVYFTKEIKLSYREAVFSFDFSSLHYAFPEKITYYYKMEGFDDDWINAGNNHTARYTNLKAGEYVFRLKASNCDGVINPNETSIKIFISPPFWETTWFRITAFIVVIVIFYLILRLRLYKLKRDKRILEAKVVERTAEIVKQKEEILEKNKELEQQKEEILTQRDEIQIQRNDIEHKNKNITASITYAQRIQQAILPDDDEIKKLLPEFFVFYKPKDIVSGDFYWISDNNNPDDKIIYIAAVDCTGHGVPGAFMSIMGHSILKQAIFEQKLKQPAEIIQFISKEINVLLRQKEKNKAVKDGMDIALLAYHKEKQLLEYAGVHNPLYLYTNSELVHYKADTFPIGEIFYSKIKAYTNNKVEIKKGDMLYIFSDGFVDQYGGVDRKKYMSKRFKELLLSLHKLEISEQKTKLEAEFDNWKANYDQIDDVLIIGFRIV